MEPYKQKSEKRKKRAPEYSDTSIILHQKIHRLMVLSVETSPAKKSGLFWSITAAFMPTDNISYDTQMIKGKNRLVPDLYLW
jgi:hypothetical protein